MIQDSGNRREFETGAVRDMAEGKGRCDLMPLSVLANTYLDETLMNDFLLHLELFQSTNNVQYLYAALDDVIQYVFLSSKETAYLELAKHFEDGCQKYGENNWKKGIPVKFYIDSAIRHALKWNAGWDDEHHDRAILWNIVCAIWTCTELPEMNDYSGKTVKEAESNIKKESDIYDNDPEFDDDDGYYELK